MIRKTNVAVLISGNGSNLQALIDACRQPDFPAHIVTVLSNKADVYGLTRARNAGIACEVISHTGFGSREAFDRAVHATLQANAVEFVCLAGFMRVLSPWFVEQWRGRMINIHPSLLPAFKGTHTHEAALSAGVKIHGCTVHHVTAEMDAGAPIMQVAVPVLREDTAETLAARVLAAEHRIYPAALRYVLTGISYPVALASDVLIGGA